MTVDRPVYETAFLTRRSAGGRRKFAVFSVSAGSWSGRGAQHAAAGTVDLNGINDIKKHKGSLHQGGGDAPRSPLNFACKS